MPVLNACVFGFIHFRMKGMSATRPKLNLLHILENVAAAGGCASQAWAPHFELGFRVMESGRNQDGQGQNLPTDFRYCQQQKMVVKCTKTQFSKACSLRLILCMKTLKELTKCLALLLTCRCTSYKPRSKVKSS